MAHRERDTVTDILNTLRYADADSVSDMSNKIHGLADEMDKEVTRWRAYRAHLVTCPEIGRDGTWGTCEQCTSARAELMHATEATARYMDIDALWRMFYAHNHETRVINWQGYAEIMERSCDLIHAIRRGARLLLIEESQFSNGTVEVLADVLSELGGVSWDEYAQREALMDKAREQYAEWNARRNALVALIIGDGDEGHFTQLGEPLTEIQSTRLVMTAARLRMLENERNWIDDTYKQIVETVNRERRAQLDALN